MSTLTARRRTAGSKSAVVTRADALLASCAEGDHAAFAALYDETSSRAYGLAVRLLRDHNRAEDVVQEAYLKIWRTAARFDPSRGDSLGWIFMIVHRTAVDHVRSSESQSARDGRHNREELLLHRDKSDPSHDHARASEEASVVRTALAGLSLLQRQAVELAYFEGYTYAEVAVKLGVPLGTAKTRIRTGLIRLRESRTVQATRSAS